MNTEPERKEIEPEKNKSEKNYSGEEKEVGKEDKGKKDNRNQLKLQNPLDLEKLRQKATGQEQNAKNDKRQKSVLKTDDPGHQYQRSLSAGSSLFLGILLEAEKILKLPHNSKLSNFCKDSLNLDPKFGGASFSRMFSSLVRNQ